MTTAQNQNDDLPEIFKKHLAGKGKCGDIVKWVGDLPPFPHVASQALSLVESPDTTANKLSALLGKDTALAARVLKIANSAMYARQREITTINQAIMLIGFQTLKGIIIAATLKQFSRNPSAVEQSVWENSTSTAIASKLLCKLLRNNFADELFILSLLHDLGKLVLIRQTPEDYKQVVELLPAGKTFAEAEEQVLGFSHAVIGAMVLKKWSFPKETWEPILYHHNLEAIPAQSSFIEQVKILNAADLIAHAAGIGHPEGYPDCTDAARNAVIGLNLPAESFDSLILEVKEKFEAEGSSFAKA